MKMKDHRYWGITYCDGSDVMPDTIRRTRKEAQQACCGPEYEYKPAQFWRGKWDQWNRDGCKAVRVLVRREA